MDKAKHLQYCCDHSYLERAHISISYPKASWGFYVLETSEWQLHFFLIFFKVKLTPSYFPQVFTVL